MCIGSLYKYFHVVAFASLLFLPVAHRANADPIAEFLFWDSLGQVTGQASKSIQEYRAERQLWRDKIAAAKREAAQCGNCPAAQDELKKWQKVENRFQDVAGSLAASVGMPSSVAGFLGIDLPMAAGPSPFQKSRQCTISRPSWAAQRPDFCQEAIDAHVSCLRQIQRPHELECPWLSSSIMGNACWDSHKLFQACAQKDYAAFRREQQAQELRRKNHNIPEYRDNGRLKLIIYPYAEKDPPMPPPTLVDELIRNKTFHAGIMYLMRGRSKGALDKVEIKRFVDFDVAPRKTSKCFESTPPEDEVENRVCEDLLELRHHYAPIVIACYYFGSGTILPDAVYWFEKRPKSASMEKFLRRSTNHPILKVQDARVNCPSTYSEEQKIESAYWSKVASLGIKQIPDDVKLPMSEWHRKMIQEKKEEDRARNAKALAAFPIEGYYEFSTSVYGRSGNLREGHCTITKTGNKEFNINCENTWRSRARGKFSAQASIQDEGLVATWSSGLKVIFNVFAGQLHGFCAGDKDVEIVSRSWGIPSKHLKERYIQNMSRSGRYSPGDLNKLIAKLRFSGKYDLELRREGDRAKFRCTIKEEGSYSPKRVAAMCFAESGRKFEGEGIPDYHEPIALHFNSWYPDHLKVGARGVYELRFPIDLENIPDKPIIKLSGLAKDGIEAQFVRLEGASTARGAEDASSARQSGQASEHSGLKPCPYTMAQYKGGSDVFACTCEANPQLSVRVFGTDIYTDDSHTCAAAVHAGAMTLTGGKLKIQMLPGQPHYAASTRNGVSTLKWGKWRRSFRFIETGQSVTEENQPGAGQSAAHIQGVWEGRYICGQGPTGLTLKIEGSDPSRLTARFKFYPVPENPRVPSGELEMSGGFDPQVKSFQFRPGRWIRHPIGYATVGLSGRLDASGRLTGRLPVSGCQTFKLLRASSKPRQDVGR